MQNFKAVHYRGKCLVFSAVTKSEVVYPPTSIWMLAEGPNKENLTCVSGTHITGTADWITHRLVFNVPKKTVYPSFGLGPV